MHNGVLFHHKKNRIYDNEDRVLYEVTLVSAILSYMSYTEKDKYRITSCVCGIQNTREMNKLKTET